MPKNPKLTNIEDYWDDEEIAKIADLLYEYQNLFPTNFPEVREIVGDFGETKIPLWLDAKPSEKFQKARHDQHIRVRPSKEGKLVLLYDNKLVKH